MQYLPLFAVALIPVAASVLFFLLDTRTRFSRLGYWQKQIIYGLVFGAISIMGSEFGVPVNGTTMNVRDAAPLCAGLIFGGPSGIIAGLIGGLERWFAVYWGAGMFSRMGCSAACILAGCIAAGCRKWMRKNGKIHWIKGFIVGLVMEDLHMILIFFSNFSEVHTAFDLVRACVLPMSLANGLALALAIICIALLSKDRIFEKRGQIRDLSYTFSKYLMAVIIVMLAFTCIFTYVIQNKWAEENSNNILKTNIDDVVAAIEDESNYNLLKLTRGVKRDLDNTIVLSNEYLKVIRDSQINSFSEVNVINEEGIVTHSTNSDFIGFDMASGAQSAEFLVLLMGEEEYVQECGPITYDNSIRKYAGAKLKKGGFVQVGYDAERFQRDIDERVVTITNNRHVGAMGYMIVVGDDGKIVSGPDFAEGFSVKEELISGAAPRVRHEKSIDGISCYYMYDISEGYYIAAVQPVEEVLFGQDLSIGITVLMEILIYAALYVLIYLLIEHLIVKKVHKVNDTLQQITAGNLDLVVDVRSNEEFNILSGGINTTVDAMKGYIAEAAARLDKELEVAKIIQYSTLPAVFPPYPERKDFDIFAQMNTAKEVGGDFYDFYMLDDGRLAFLVADVSGKGITGAMFMMKAKTLIKKCAEEIQDAAQILTQANEGLCEGNEAGMFVTCWLGILDFEKRKITFANAGHNPPLVRHKDGAFEYHRTRPGFVLGGMEGIRYRSGEIELQPGDEIFLYTDGVTEATNPDNQLYGDDRLKSTLDALRGKNVEEICHEVKEDVDRFADGAPQFDDITMLCIRYNA